MWYFNSNKHFKDNKINIISTLKTIKYNREWMRGGMGDYLRLWSKRLYEEMTFELKLEIKGKIQSHKDPWRTIQG